ncbi:transglycosylase domain-containing protein [uncultured Friedmanniella sp.]|uniref:transglycosylase domain-containing protein n=1 Tax=uncultured Friedmanniella sp. TaxID=335381 RepID=UPI0035CC788B
MPSSSRPPLGRRASAVTFTLVSVLAGLLVVGLTLPGLGAAAWASRRAADNLSSLPLDLGAQSQSQRSQVLDANGDVLAYFYTENRVYVSLDKIAPVMQQAIVSIEDHRFYEHGPIDLIGTLRAFLRNSASDGATQGGSSITQQYVKMVQVEAAKRTGNAQAVQDAQASTYTRKIRELRYAISVEKSLSKDQILERYLNIAYYGDGAYGVEAAAEHYFDTTAAKLTLPQAAMLAGLVQNPGGLDPVTNPSGALQRRDVVLARMAELKTASAANVTKAKKTGFDKADVTGVPNGCQPSDYPFLCDYVQKTLLATPSLGASAKARKAALEQGGLTIDTAIDPKTQDATQQAVSRVVGPTDPLISAMDMVEPGTGRILAMAQSRPEMGSNTKAGETYWNYSVAPDMGGNQGFQAGSTFKAFTAAAALEQGLPLSQRYDAKETMDFSGASFESCSGTTQVGGDFTVSNSTGTNGVMDMTTAAEHSVNTYFVQLALEVGMCDVTQMAEKVGVVSSTPDAPISSYDDKPSFTLGTAEVSPLSMATAYATFASGGMHCSPVILDKVTTSSGESLAVPDAGCTRVLSTEVANTMNSLLSSVMTDGTGARAATADGRPQAGKTGTIDSNAAVWFVGYTPEASGAAMISVDNEQQPFVKDKAGYRPTGVKGYTVPSTGLTLEGSGSGDSGQEIWKPAMESYLAGQPATAFGPPSAALVRGAEAQDPRSREGFGRDAGPDNGFGRR